MNKLIENIDALLELDAKGALVPHGIGGMARELFEKCKVELNTRAVPDVPELVTAAQVSSVRTSQAIFAGHVLSTQLKAGDLLVSKDQAAEIIAAKDKEIERLRSLNHYAALEAQAIKRAEAAGAKNIELEAAWLNAEGKISDLEAKLAQYEAQDPVAWVNENGMAAFTLGGISTVHTQFETRKSERFRFPLYASPAPAADLKEKCDRYEQALEKISEEFELTTSRIRLRDIARAALNVEASHDKG